MVLLYHGLLSLLWSNLSSWAGLSISWDIPSLVSWVQWIAMSSIRHATWQTCSTTFGLLLRFGMQPRGGDQARIKAWQWTQRRGWGKSMSQYPIHRPGWSVRAAALARVGVEDTPPEPLVASVYGRGESCMCGTGARGRLGRKRRRRLDHASGSSVCVSHAGALGPVLESLVFWTYASQISWGH